MTVTTKKDGDNSNNNLVESSETTNSRYVNFRFYSYFLAVVMIVAGALSEVVFYLFQFNLVAQMYACTDNFSSCNVETVQGFQIGTEDALNTFAALGTMTLVMGFFFLFTMHVRKLKHMQV